MGLRRKVFGVRFQVLGVRREDKEKGDSRPMLVSRVTGHASRVISLCILASLVLLAPLRAGEVPFEPGKDGWLTLFDGSDLARWEPAKGADWALKDAVLAGSKGEIASYWHWLDFELAAVCRGSGALRFRASLGPMLDQPGYRLDLADGSVLTAQGALVAKGEAARKDGWREVHLVVSKGRFTVEFDGQKVAEGSAEACPAKGFLALAPPLELKLLRARPLNREKHINVPAPDSACFVCHANFDGEKIARQHRARERDENDDENDEHHLRPAKQRPRRAGCAGCHGPSLDHRSDEDNVTTPDIMYTRGEVEGACLQCHIRHKAETKRQDGKGPPPTNPVCTDCHGKHRTSN